MKNQISLLSNSFHQFQTCDQLCLFNDYELCGILKPLFWDLPVVTRCTVHIEQINWDKKKFLDEKS